MRQHAGMYTACYRLPMERLTLPELKREIDHLAALIQAPADSLPTYGRTRDYTQSSKALRPS